MKYKEREKLAERNLKTTIRFNRLKRNQGSKRIVPSVYSDDPVERSLGFFLSGIKHAKWHPEKARRVFYPSLLDVVVEKDAVSILEPVRTKDNAIKKFQATIDWISENGRLPRSTVYDPIENSHLIKLNNLQSIKEGKLLGIWHPEYDEMIASVGYPAFFEFENEGAMIENDIDDICRFYKKYGQVPSQLGGTVERKLYRKLIRLRQIKQGKTPLKWNPAIDATLKSKKIKNFFEV
jgi:hypothetical protein